MARATGTRAMPRAQTGTSVTIPSVPHAYGPQKPLTSSTGTGLPPESRFFRSTPSSRYSSHSPSGEKVGEKVDAKVTNIDSANRRLTLSIKALEIEDEKQAMADYGSSDSGASLGDILGPAIKGRQEQQEQNQDR